MNEGKKYFTIYIKSLRVVKNLNDYDPNCQDNHEVTLEDTVENRRFARMLSGLCLQREVIESVNF